MWHGSSCEVTARRMYIELKKADHVTLLGKTRGVQFDNRLQLTDNVSIRMQPSTASKGLFLNATHVPLSQRCGDLISRQITTIPRATTTTFAIINLQIFYCSLLSIFEVSKHQTAPEHKHDNCMTINKRPTINDERHRPAKGQRYW